MRSLDGSLRAVLAFARWIALPVALLLCLQWPLREWVQAGSREANDFGQWVFALLVAASVLAATRSRRHIATDAVAERFSARTKATLMRIGILVGLLPWAVFVLWSAAAPIGQSIAQLERFPDTGNPGYFMIKVAVGALLTGVIVQALLDLVRGADAIVDDTGESASSEERQP